MRHEERILAARWARSARRATSLTCASALALHLACSASGPAEPPSTPTAATGTPQVAPPKPELAPAAATESAPAARAEPPLATDAPWPGIARLAQPEPSECTYTGKQPWLLWQTRADELVPLRRARWPAVVDALPFRIPAELEAKGGSSRTVVTVNDGWLVAMDHGEFGAGLYWVESRSLRLHVLDARLADRVRWVGASGSSILAVAGLCHGISCEGKRTSIYEVRHGADGRWQLSPTAVFDGCPAAVAIAPSDQALLVASDCGTLQRVDRNGARPVLSWPRGLQPVDIIARDEPGTYHMSFGPYLAHFTSKGADWFAARECVKAELQATGDCRCVAADP